MSLTMSSSHAMNNNNNNIIIINNPQHIINNNVSSINSGNNTSIRRQPPTSILRRPKYTNVATMAAQAAHRSDPDVIKDLDERLPNAWERVRDKYLTHDPEALENLKYCLVTAECRTQTDQLLLQMQKHGMSLRVFKATLVHIVNATIDPKDPRHKVTRQAAVAKQYKSSLPPRSDTPSRVQWNDDRNTTRVYLVESTAIQHHQPKRYTPVEYPRMGWHTQQQVTAARRGFKRKSYYSKPLPSNKRRRFDTAPADDQDVFGLDLFQQATPSTYYYYPEPQPAVEEPQPQPVQDPQQPIDQQPTRRCVRFAAEPQRIEYEMTDDELSCTRKRLRAYDRHEELVMKLRAKEVYVHRKRSPMGYCLTRDDEREIIEQAEVQQPVEIPQVLHEEPTTTEPAEIETPVEEIPQATTIDPVPVPEPVEFPVHDLNDEIPQEAPATIVPQPVETEPVAPEAVAIPVAIQQDPVPVTNTPTPPRRSPRLAALRQKSQQPTAPTTNRRPRTAAPLRRSPRLAAQKRVCYKC